MANDNELLGARYVPDKSGTSSGIPNIDQGLLDAVDLPTVVISRDCTVARFNRAATTLLGLTASDLGCPVSNLVAGDANLDKLCAQVIADGIASRREVRDGDRTFLLR